jgi:hypothetical protein
LLKLFDFGGLCRVRLTDKKSCSVATTTLLLLAAITVAAQEQTPKLPDAPSATQSANVRGSATSSTHKDVIEVLARRSSFFPDLAATTGPLTSGQKFKLFLNNSVSGYAFTRAAAGAGISQAADTNSGYGQGGDGYGKRVGSSLATTASTNFFGTFLLASMLRQDPRFFVQKDLSFGETVEYAVRRAVVTRSDAGADTFNWSGLLAPLGAEGLANTYLPEAERTTGRTFSRYGVDLALGVGGNFLRQCWPAIDKRLLRPKQGTQPAQSSGSATPPAKPASGAQDTSPR